MSPAFQDSFLCRLKTRELRLEKLIETNPNLAFFDSFITQGTPHEVSPYSADVPVDVGRVLATWPSWRVDQRLQANLNQTGGSLTTGTDNADPYHDIIQTYVEPGLVPDFGIVDGYTWEGGRGERCDFWRSIGASVPEKK